MCPRRGGMGEVFRGRDTRVNRHVAIKFLRAQLNDRFERAARATSSLPAGRSAGLVWSPDSARSPRRFFSRCQIRFQISPDGKWLPYQADEGGVSEIYVSDFPGLSIRRRIFGSRWD
jgi:serine/threonine protein kinase